MLIQFLSPIGIHLKNIHSPLNMTTLPTWKKTIRRTFFQRCKKKKCQRVACILSSCVWDVLEVQRSTTSTRDVSTPGWWNHRQALRNLLLFFNATYPKSTVVWKSCAAMHIHVPFLFEQLHDTPNKGMQQRTKYMSTSRTMDLYTMQKKIVNELMQTSQVRPRLVFLDIYGAYFLSSYFTKPGDGRHYEASFNQRIVHWFSNDSTTTLVNKF